MKNQFSLNDFFLFGLPIPWEKMAKIKYNTTVDDFFPCCNVAFGKKESFYLSKSTVRNNKLEYFTWEQHPIE